MAKKETPGKTQKKTPVYVTKNTETTQKKTQKIETHQ